ncbi:MAG: TetR/AcrR family transcriptional regulator [Acidobacteriaceae bacterium]
MKTKIRRREVRRVPAQARAQVTVEAMLDAAIRLLKRRGAGSITTNRIAQTAGVSIGSVYQYFPNKRAIFVALHERHIRQVDKRMERCMREGADASLGEVAALLIDAMIEMHEADPELSELLQAEVPHSAAGTPGLAVRLYGPVRKVLAARSGKSRRAVELDMQAFFLSNMVEAFGHAMVLRRPAGLSLARAKSETLRAISTYLQC